MITLIMSYYHNPTLKKKTLDMTTLSWLSLKVEKSSRHVIIIIIINIIIIFITITIINIIIIIQLQTEGEDHLHD